MFCTASRRNRSRLATKTSSLPEAYKDLMGTDVSKDRKSAACGTAIESTPRQAVSMRARSELMMALQEWVKAACKTQRRPPSFSGHPAPHI